MAIARAETADNGKEGFGQKVGAWPKRVKNYFGELQTEMRRVTWPSWKQVRATTTVVIVAVFAFAAYFFVVDWAVGGIVSRILSALSK